MSPASPGGLRPLASFLSAGDLPDALTRRADLAPYRRALLDLVPLDILSAVDVLKVADGVVLLRADSPAVATRLRQVQARVRRGLVALGLSAESIKVKVLSPSHHRRAAPPPRPARPLSKAARAACARAAAAVRDEALRELLLQMSGREKA